MAKIKFDFIENPEKTVDAADVLMPHLSKFSKKDLLKMKAGATKPCDAVCLPPGYGPCNCWSNLVYA
ncbi:MAG: hypothetical protein MUF15_23160 [Acidobacteria bacterium]|jgi:hypothetical protein|nr:hypothetical protein [Acidobacteriota bacterium]